MMQRRAPLGSTGAAFLRGLLAVHGTLTAISIMCVIPLDVLIMYGI